ncbi:hypothetical protein NOCARDAX2BIS_170110 [Nocardioides sp. AX2bis]|nr:hypothetical protein NOCARDAX2BIS_170110 [Nocardioides sp. AX2bis]
MKPQQWYAASVVEERPGGRGASAASVTRPKAVAPVVEERAQRASRDPRRWAPVVEE